jgi:hypothetical protein
VFVGRELAIAPTPVFFSRCCSLTTRLMLDDAGKLEPRMGWNRIAQAPNDNTQADSPSPPTYLKGGHIISSYACSWSRSYADRNDADRR